MSGTKLAPEKITSPMQLMAAWFSMLVLLTGVLLTAAANITVPAWGAAYLIIFSSVVVVVVIACVLCMLTIFRPHLQDGKEYAQWLKSKGQYSRVVQSGRLRASTSKESSVTYVHIPSPPVKSAEVPPQGDTPRPSFSLRSCVVSVVDMQGAISLASKLNDSGFKVEIYNDQFDEERIFDAAKQESIWVGSEVPAADVIKALKIAIQDWPFLKYLHLSGDNGSNPPDYVHEQIFLGGSSSTSERLKLSPWTNDEILALDESMSNEMLHRAIRRKY
ncbi:hypothetical protein [Stutzerimonas nitrititolerans]|uniref:hypothetical protein n=1 Tax=Stutzerimonas nitrititolerans TaxID=2482751 RepID=UPI002898E9B0|nr:hypothetical protein [Stutzerimonas nitrititolerans]